MNTTELIDYLKEQPKCLEVYAVQQTQQQEYVFSENKSIETYFSITNLIRHRANKEQQQYNDQPSLINIDHIIVIDPQFFDSQVISKLELKDNLIKLQQQQQQQSEQIQQSQQQQQQNRLGIISLCSTDKEILECFNKSPCEQLDQIYQNIQFTEYTCLNTIHGILQKIQNIFQLCNQIKRNNAILSITLLSALNFELNYQKINLKESNLSGEINPEDIKFNQQENKKRYFNIEEDEDEKENIRYENHNYNRIIQNNNQSQLKINNDNDDQNALEIKEIINQYLSDSFMKQYCNNTILNCLCLGNNSNNNHNNNYYFHKQLIELLPQSTYYPVMTTQDFLFNFKEIISNLSKITVTNVQINLDFNNNQSNLIQIQDIQLISHDNSDNDNKEYQFVYPFIYESQYINYLFKVKLTCLDSIDNDQINHIFGMNRTTFTYNNQNYFFERPFEISIVKANQQQEQINNKNEIKLNSKCEIQMNLQQKIIPLLKQSFDYFVQNNYNKIQLQQQQQQQQQQSQLNELKELKENIEQLINQINNNQNIKSEYIIQYSHYILIYLLKYIQMKEQSLETYNPIYNKKLSQKKSITINQLKQGLFILINQMFTISFYSYRRSSILKYIMKQ